MPRRTTQAFRFAHDQLRSLWLNDRYVYSRLSPTEQWQLHDYFQPSEALTAAGLLEHRKQISRERPSLPQQAGKALVKIEAAAAARSRVKAPRPPVSAGKGSRPPRGHITVAAVVRPKIDYDMLRRALEEIAKTNPDLADQLHKEQKRKDDQAA